MSLGVETTAKATGRHQGSLWKEELTNLLPLLGHRNWIVITDSAYPLQTSSGITPIATHTGSISVLREALTLIEKAPHVRANIYVDKELSYVQERFAPGVESFRKELTETFSGKRPNALPHEDIIYKLGNAGKDFRILLLKTTLTIPYTSVFLELDCGYWTADAEQELRAAIAKDSQE